MKAKLFAFLNGIFYRIPKEYAADFREDSLEKNIQRFSILPFFNILTQVSCIFIYLYVYPTVYPERKQLDAKFFLIFSAVYLAINILFAAIFLRLRRCERPRKNLKWPSFAVYAFIMCYVALESSLVAIELEISGNIYRFLATFFVVSFFPVVGRLARLGYMTTYILISELMLSYIQLTGVNIYSYPEINAIVFLVCSIASNIHYTSTIRNFELRKKLEFLSTNDSLTGLANRRYLNSYLESYWKTSIRNEGILGALMIDIDNFKRYNDTYGHHAGDVCLVAVANAVKGCFDRSTDICARYGGEEFVVIFSHISPEGLTSMAEKVRAAVEALNIVHDGNPPYGKITCSVGAAAIRPEIDQQPELLLRQADEALYTAKNAGRNRYEIYNFDV